MLLATINCPELVADNLNSYIELAVNLAQQPEQQYYYKQQLRSYLKNSALTDAEDFANQFTEIITQCRQNQMRQHSSARGEKSTDRQHPKTGHSTTPTDSLNRQKITINDTEVLKIAYLSGDFRDHPVGHNLINLFRLHDRNKFHVTVFSSGPNDNSIYRRRIEKDCDRFIDIKHIPDIEAAKIIRENRIDILVELMGHTRDNRLKLCAFRPAPLQISYLGYPGTTGANFIDYLIADRTVIPADYEKFYSEKIIYLPESFMIADRPHIAPLPERQTYKLPPESFIFCSFNSAYKIEPVMFDIWMKILKQVPQAILWLRGGNSTMENNLRNEANRRKVDPQRLIFAAKVQNKEDHLARLQLADLCLDTRIYNGHTTTLDALWAGTPVITLLGSHFASRVSSSNLKAVGLPQLITDDLESYKNLAISLARKTENLNKIKETLIANCKTAPLFDTEAKTLHLEKAYLKIWQNHKNRKPATATTIF